MSYAPNPFSDKQPPPAPTSNNAVIILTILTVLCGIGLLVCGGVIVGGVLFVRQVERSGAQATLQDVNSAPFTTQADLSQYYNYRNSGQYGEAKAELEKSLAFYPNDAMLHNELAWLLATCPAAEMRDGAIAVEHATQACTLTNWSSVAYIDTLAASYAESGDFESAVKWQQTAMDKDFQGAFTGTGFEKRLDMYKNRQTYQEGPLPSSMTAGEVGAPMPVDGLLPSATPDAGLPTDESTLP